MTFPQCLCQFLFDEERAQMRQLPCTGNTQHTQLNQRPAHDFCICLLALVTELGLSLLLRSVSLISSEIVCIND
jgi:hypothetical protein